MIEPCEKKNNANEDGFRCVCSPIIITDFWNMEELMRYLNDTNQEMYEKLKTMLLHIKFLTPREVENIANKK